MSPAVFAARLLVLGATIAYASLHCRWGFGELPKQKTAWANLGLKARENLGNCLRRLGVVLGTAAFSFAPSLVNCAVLFAFLLMPDQTRNAMESRNPSLEELYVEYLALEGRLLRHQISLDDAVQAHLEIAQRLPTLVTRNFFMEAFTTAAFSRLTGLQDESLMLYSEKSCADASLDIAALGLGSGYVLVQFKSSNSGKFFVRKHYPNQLLVFTRVDGDHIHVWAAPGSALPDNPHGCRVLIHGPPTGPGISTVPSQPDSLHSTVIMSSNEHRVENGVDLQRLVARWIADGSLRPSIERRNARDLIIGSANRKGDVGEAVAVNILNAGCWYACRGRPIHRSRVNQLPFDAFDTVAKKSIQIRTVFLCDEADKKAPADVILDQHQSAFISFPANTNLPEIRSAPHYTVYLLMNRAAQKPIAMYVFTRVELARARVIRIAEPCEVDGVKFDKPQVGKASMRLPLPGHDTFSAVSLRSNMITIEYDSSGGISETTLSALASHQICSGQFMLPSSRSRITRDRVMPYRWSTVKKWLVLYLANYLPELGWEVRVAFFGYDIALQPPGSNEYHDVSLTVCDIDHEARQWTDPPNMTSDSEVIALWSSKACKPLALVSNGALWPWWIRLDIPIDKGSESSESSDSGSTQRKRQRN